MKINLNIDPLAQFESICIGNVALYSVVQFVPYYSSIGIYNACELEHASRYYIKGLVLSRNDTHTTVLPLNINPQPQMYNNNYMVFPLLIDSVNLKGKNTKPVTSKTSKIPKGGVKIGDKVYSHLAELVANTCSRKVQKHYKKLGNKSYLRLKRDKNGHFIKMDNIAEFDYPHAADGCNQFRIVKVIKDTPDYIEGIQTNCGNTGFKKFKKPRIQGLFRYKGYLK